MDIFYYLLEEINSWNKRQLKKNDFLTEMCSGIFKSYGKILGTFLFDFFNCTILSNYNLVESNKYIFLCYRINCAHDQIFTSFPLFLHIETFGIPARTCRTYLIG